MTYAVPYVEEDKRSLKNRIDPAHLVLAIENSMEHSHETTHGVTGVTFANYSIMVIKRKGYCWIVELRFKGRERTDAAAQRALKGVRCRTRQNKQS